MNDFNCPYCNQEGEVDWEDSDFFTDSAEIEYECGACERKYVVTTCVSYSYDAECSEHDWGIYQRYLNNPTPEQEVHFKKMEQHAWCKNCNKCGDLEDIKEPV